MYANDNDDVVLFIDGHSYGASTTEWNDPMAYWYHKLGYLQDSTYKVFIKCPASSDYPADSIADFVYSAGVYYQIVTSYNQTFNNMRVAALPISKFHSTGFSMADGTAGSRWFPNTAANLRFRHNNRCNGLYGDGHVQDLPESAKGYVAYEDHDLCW